MSFSRVEFMAKQPVLVFFWGGGAGGIVLHRYE